MLEGLRRCASASDQNPNFVLEFDSFVSWRPLLATYSFSFPLLPLWAVSCRNMEPGSKIRIFAKSPLERHSTDFSIPSFHSPCPYAPSPPLTLPLAPPACSPCCLQTVCPCSNGVGAQQSLFQRPDVFYMLPAHSPYEVGGFPRFDRDQWRTRTGLPLTTAKKN